MDLKMNAESIGEDIEWDCNVTNGVVPILKDDEESLQCAVLAGFLIKGTIPQLPDAGVPWTDFLQKKISFGELDFYVRESLRNADKETFYPQYDIQNDRLVMTVGQLEMKENV